MQMVCKTGKLSSLSRIKRVAAITLGCKVNLYDTQAMLELFQNKGYEIVPFGSEADIYIINTCTVTNMGDKKSRQMIQRAAKHNTLVIVTGCYAQMNPEAVKRIRGVNLVLGTKERERIVEIAEAYSDNMGVYSYVSDVRSETDIELLRVTKFYTDGRTRAFLKIQDGCDNFCSYCIIPYARGPARSREPDDVLSEAHRLSVNGYKEIVLTGIHAASYGKDLKNTSLVEILLLLNEIKGIERIRLSSIDPVIVNREFIKVLSSLPKLCDHFHLSLQSGCNSVLRRMNRHYTAEHYRESADMLKAAFPGGSLTTDIIAGFPGETQAEFEQTLIFVEKIGFMKIHVFPFSPKTGTDAASMPNQVSDTIKSKRVALLMEISKGSGQAFMEAFIGKALKVLIEKQHETGVFEGHATNYIKVRTRSLTNIVNQIKIVRVDRVQHDCVYGSILHNG